jgi:predicted alpha/beta-fold hydrolase
MLDATFLRSSYERQVEGLAPADRRQFRGFATATEFSGAWILHVAGPPTSAGSWVSSVGEEHAMTARAQPTSNSVTVNGLRLHYLEWGKAGMPAVVCVHGYTGSAQAFNSLARHLQDRFHVLAMDVRGHGESEWSATGAYEYADQAGDLAACRAFSIAMTACAAKFCSSAICFAEKGRTS